jgi:acetyl esterase/lipase
MDKKNKTIQKFHKYPISDEFGIYKLYRIPFDERIFKNADKLMSFIPKILKDTKNISFNTKSVKSYDGEKIDIYIFEPQKQSSNKIFLYIHGGGFVYRGAKNHYMFCKKLAEEGLCTVVYVDYRLAYKYKYPVPVEDAFAAYDYILKHCKNYSKVLIGGDSAGGCLAIDVIRKAKENFLRIPDYLFLLYPVLDKRMNTESMKKYTDTPVWNAVLNKKMWDLYLKGNEDYISPGEMKDVSFMPKTYIETAEFDCLHDEAIEFAEKLKKEHIEVVVNETKNTMHGFDMKNGKITQKIVNERMELIKKI